MFLSLEVGVGPIPFRRSRSSSVNQQIIPLAMEAISAGFPSPADDYIDTGIDLNEELIRHPASTFFLRVSGHSMNGGGIYNGDLLVVDRSIDPIPGRVVVALLDGVFTLKRLVNHKGTLRLEAENSNYPPINLNSYNDVQVWGVAMYSIHSLTTSSQQYI